MASVCDVCGLGAKREETTCESITRAWQGKPLSQEKRGPLKIYNARLYHGVCLDSISFHERGVIVTEKVAAQMKKIDITNSPEDTKEYVEKAFQGTETTQLMGAIHEKHDETDRKNTVQVTCAAIATMACIILGIATKEYLF